MAILRIEPNIVNSGGDFTFNNVVATSNITAGNVLSSSFYWANGAPFISSNYGDANVDAYLGSYFTYANANASTQSTAIDTINANVEAANLAIIDLQGNAGSQAIQINSIDANIGAYQIWANANVAGQYTYITSVDANVTAANLAISTLQSNVAFQANLIDVLTGNAATQGSLLDTLVANAAQQSANLTSLLSNAAAQEASLTSLVNNAAAQSSAIDTINANIGAYQTYANANAATQQTTIDSINANLGSYQVWANTVTYSNANVSSYLTAAYPIVNDGALRLGSGSGPDVYVDALNNVYVGHGGTNYSTVNVDGRATFSSNATFTANAAFSNGANLTINSASNITVKTGAGIHLQSGANIYGDSAYLNSIVVSGNAATGNVSANGYYFANGAPFVSSNYGESNVAAYLSSYFIYANANAATQQTAIDSINSNIGAYQTYANANAATQTTSIDSINANLGSYQTWANTSISTLQSNAALQASLIDVLTGNAATQGSVLDTLVANAATQASTLTTLLSNAAAQEASLTTLVSNAAGQSTAIDTINANIGAYQTYANANAAAQATSINTINANVTATNAAIITANTGMKSYVDTQISNISITPGGSNTQVQFNDSGSFAGNAGLTFDKTTTTLTVNNLNVATSSNLGLVGNLVISGGSPGQVLTTNGAGGLSWGTISSSGTATATTDIFTGDGSTTIYTLSVTPASEDWVTVNYNGVTLLRSDYTVSGTTITFSTAPALGAKFEVTTLSSVGGTSSGISTGKSIAMAIVFGF